MADLHQITAVVSDFDALCALVEFPMLTSAVQCQDTGLPRLIIHSAAQVRWIGGGQGQ